jgi:putative transposase
LYTRLACTGIACVGSEHSGRFESPVFGGGGVAFAVRRINAMAEALNSVYKAELIDRKVWSGLVEVMAETSTWVAWYNGSRLHSAIDYRPPIEVHSEWINQTMAEAAAA